MKWRCNHMWQRLPYAVEAAARPAQCHQRPQDEELPLQTNRWPADTYSFVATLRRHYRYGYAPYSIRLHYRQSYTTWPKVCHELRARAGPTRVPPQGCRRQHLRNYRRWPVRSFFCVFCLFSPLQGGARRGDQVDARGPAPCLKAPSSWRHSAVQYPGLLGQFFHVTGCVTHSGEPLSRSGPGERLRCGYEVRPKSQRSTCRPSSTIISLPRSPGGS